MWADHDRHYTGIVHGVRFTCELIQALRRFVEQAEIASPVGEIANILMELRTLLDRPRFSQVPEKGIGGRVWKTLRLDQAFRLHEKVAITRLVQLIYETDALVALADVTHQHGFVLPCIEAGSLRIHAEGLAHPFVQNAVANSVALNQEHRVLFLTGPNMAGKTTYLRAAATALYLAHLGMGVPARRFSFVPVQRLFTSISLNDDLHNGVSYFRAEALRIKAVAEAVAEGYRVVAILERFVQKQGCLFMFSSHLIELSEQLRSAGQIDYRYFQADESEGRLRFDYLLQPGVSSQRLGMRVLREEGIFELLDGNEKGDQGINKACLHGPNFGWSSE